MKKKSVGPAYCLGNGGQMMEGRDDIFGWVDGQ